MTVTKRDYSARNLGLEEWMGWCLEVFPGGVFDELRGGLFVVYAREMDKGDSVGAFYEEFDTQYEDPKTKIWGNCWRDNRPEAGADFSRALGLRNG